MRRTRSVVPAPLVRTLFLLVPCLAADLSAQGFRWVRVPTLSGPSARFLPASAGDVARQRVVLFGGDDGQTLGDTWLWDGRLWQPASPVASPPARSAHAMAYDAARQRVVLFGGMDAAQVPFADTWTWDGVAWTQTQSVTAPSARAGHTMAFDRTSQSVLLFGGSGAGALGDTWRWDGATWTQLLPAASPIARSRHAMADDTARQRIVLFGGRNAANVLLADTWEWTGSSWLPALGVIGLPNPAARQGHAIAFDASRNRTVLFGGVDGQGQALGDTWAFDGGHWAAVAPSAPIPQPRRDHMLVDDVTRRGLLLFGGRAGASLGDSWSDFDDRALPYGVGCGSPPVRFVPDDGVVPVLGQVASATIFDAPTQVASVALGFSNQYFGPFPLPLTLAGVGLPGCDLLQSAEVFGLATTPLSPNSVAFALAIPNLPGLLGLHVYLQAVVLAPGQNPAQAVVSNGIDWTIGDGTIPLRIDEDFASGANQDVTTSSSIWNNGARPGTIGNDGRHGSFDVTLGTPLGGDVYQWDTDNFVIPASLSLTGQSYVVTDGRFYFTDFVLPAGTTLTFTGTVPPQVWVRGNADIGGTIDISAPDLPSRIPTTGTAVGQKVSLFNAIGPSTGYSVSTPNFAAGQPGGAPGIGGGRGGAGGDECKLDGDVVQTIGLEMVHIYYGRNGQDVRLQAGHAYAANAVGTGGQGSQMFPLGGLVSSIDTSALIGFLYRKQYTPGGGGGGFSGAGSTATQVWNGISGVALFGPGPAGGSAFGLLPLPIPQPVSSLNHFVVGGSGGGGGGSHVWGTQNSASVGYYMAGSAGTGGGGAMAIRVGGDLTIASTARLLARGGDGVLINGDGTTLATQDVNWGVSSPGGGGSGGSFLLQAGRTLACQAELNVRGGTGSRNGSVSQNGITVAAFNLTAQAGNGAPGFYRLEAGSGTPTFTGTAQPAFDAATNTGPLTDRDGVTGTMSKWRGSGAGTPPTWQRYELDVDLDGDGTVDVTYTDSGAAGTLVANDPFGAVRIEFQGAAMDPTGTFPLPGTLGPWRDGIGTGSGPGIQLDAANGFRFQLLFNAAVSPNAVVRALRVFAQG